MTELVPIVFANKVASPGYNGGTYSVVKSLATGGNVFTRLTYSSSGTATFTRSTGAGVSGSPNTQSWSWTTSPGSAYEVSVSFSNNPISSGVTPSSSGSGWTAIGAATVVANLSTNNAGSNGISTFTISVRRVGRSSPIVTTTISLSSEWTPV